MADFEACEDDYGFWEDRYSEAEELSDKWLDAEMEHGSILYDAMDACQGFMLSCADRMVQALAAGEVADMLQERLKEARESANDAADELWGCMFEEHWWEEE